MSEDPSTEGRLTAMRELLVQIALGRSPHEIEQYLRGGVQDAQEDPGAVMTPAFAILEAAAAERRIIADLLRQALSREPAPRSTP